MSTTRTVYAKDADVTATAELVIQDFVGAMTSSKPGRYFSTDTFMVGDNPMELRVYPNGYSDEEKGNVSAFLWNLSDVGVTVKYQMISNVPTDVVEREPEPEVKANNGRGFFKFLSHAQCKDAYQDKDKDFVVTVNVQISGEFLKITGTQAVPKHFDVRKSLHNQMKGANFTLIFKGEEVPCHKQVLAAASPVFEAMVENQHLEAIESKANIELTAEVGRAFVKYVYTGELENGLLKDQAWAFLELGEKYDVQELKDLAEVELLNQLTKENMVESVSLGDLFHANKIFEAALKMTRANMTWLRSQV